jgi:hypothetical protein
VIRRVTGHRPVLTERPFRSVPASAADRDRLAVGSGQR